MMMPARDTYVKKMSGLKHLQADINSSRVGVKVKSIKITAHFSWKKTKDQVKVFKGQIFNSLVNICEYKLCLFLFT